MASSFSYGMNSKVQAEASATAQNRFSCGYENCGKSYKKKALAGNHIAEKHFGIILRTLPYGLWSLTKTAKQAVQVLIVDTASKAQINTAAAAAPTTAVAPMAIESASHVLTDDENLPARHRKTPGLVKMMRTAAKK